MSDSEFQYEPCHYHLLKRAIDDLYLRFGYEKVKKLLLFKI